MYKKLAFLLALSFMCISKSHAAGSFEPALMYQTAVTSITMRGVQVSTAANGGIGTFGNATQMDNPQLKWRATIEIQNIDTIANLWCTAVSSIPVTTGGSRKIVPGSSWVVGIHDQIPDVINGPTFVKFWCISDGVAFTTATVTQLY